MKYQIMRSSWSRDISSNKHRRVKDFGTLDAFLEAVGVASLIVLGTLLVMNVSRDKAEKEGQLKTHVSISEANAIADRPRNL